MIEFAALTMIVFLIVLLLWVAWLVRQQRAADRREMAALKRITSALDAERDAVFDDIQHQADEVVIDFIRKLNSLYARHSEICPYCGEHVDALQQVGRCVYTRPCGCRIGQGIVPEVWKTGES